VNLTIGQRIFHPSLLGKLCTGSQVTTAGVVLLLNCLREAPAAMTYVFAATAGLTVLSALHYVYIASANSGVHAAQ
jgi:phosphatidylglycerophosphate synthase